jgi:protocatechuate 3,4-dioxygenase beta subunit
MMKMLRWIAPALFATVLAACGGGGGSAGTNPTGGGGGAATPTVAVSMVDASGAATTSVTAGSTVTAKATVKDASGNPVSGAVVTFAGDSNAPLNFVPANGTALTGADGVATIQLTPALSSSGAGTLTATAAVGSAAAKGTTSYQVPNAVANVVMLLDKSTLPNSGASNATLTLIAVDTANNVVPGAPVSVTTDANTVFTPGSTTTDANGKFTGTLSIGSDKTDRQVTISANVSGLVKKTTVSIVGSNLAVTSTPSVLTPGGAAKLTVRLTDSAGGVISNSSVTITGDIPSLVGKSLTTDLNGNASVNFTAPVAAGSYMVIATGSGVTSSVSLQVGSGTAIPAAVIPAGAVASVSALPNVVAPNTTGSTTNQSQLRFLMIDSANKPVSNVRVRFDIVSTGLGSFDATISSGTSTVYTNASGVATASFIPGATASATDGVQVRACWQATDFASTTTCTNSVNVTMTVASQALAISIGDDNKLQAGQGTYIKTFTVTVADAAGRPVAGAPVDIFLDIPFYEKGPYSMTTVSGSPTVTVTTLGTTYNNPPKVQPYQLNQDIPDATSEPVTIGERVTCINQDMNRNGVVDPGDLPTDTDGFGQFVLLPRKSDILISYSTPGVTTTNASGILLIQVEYSQRFATWLEYHIRASTSVSGSQGTAERAFVTDFIEGDDKNGSFLTPPYGIRSCSEAN